MEQYTKDFCEFWEIYPRKIEKRFSFQCFQKAIKKGATAKEIIDGAKRYAKWLAEGDSNTWRPHPKHASTFLNKFCWEDELTEEEKRPAPYKSQNQQRLENFRRTGFWCQDWGEKPTLENFQ
jgi:hypothetical protein